MEDGRLDGAVRKILGDFEVWIGEDRMPFFPAFTDHGTQHVERVMRGAESLAVDSSWDLLTPSDAACLLLAVLLHDSAMHLSRDGFLHLVNRSRAWQPKGRFLDKMRDRPWPELWETFIREATRWDARRLIAVFDRAVPVQPPVLTSAAVWDDNHYLLIGEFLRRHHARLAQEIALEGVPGPTDNRLRFIQMPDAWTADLAGFIARSHNMPLRDALALLEPNGRRSGAECMCRISSPSFASRTTSRSTLRGRRAKHLRSAVCAVPSRASSGRSTMPSTTSASTKAIRRRSSLMPSRTMSRLSSASGTCSMTCSARSTSAGTRSATSTDRTWTSAISA